MGLAENSILTPAQKILLARLGQSTLSEQFYFTGGTALAALYLQHRLSEDIDFFTRETVPVESVLGFLRALPDVQKVEYERKFDRRLSLITGMNVETIRRGRRELADSLSEFPHHRIRRPGAGCKPLKKKRPP